MLIEAVWKGLSLLEKGLVLVGYLTHLGKCMLERTTGVCHRDSKAAFTFAVETKSPLKGLHHCLVRHSHRHVFVGLDQMQVEAKPLNADPETKQEHAADWNPNVHLKDEEFCTNEYTPEHEKLRAERQARRDELKTFRKRIEQLPVTSDFGDQHYEIPGR